MSTFQNDKNWVDNPVTGYGVFVTEEPYVGRVYYSDEVGGGVHVWTPALVDQSTLLMVMLMEADALRTERVKQKDQSHEDHS